MQKGRARSWTRARAREILRARYGWQAAKTQSIARPRASRRGQRAPRLRSGVSQEDLELVRQMNRAFNERRPEWVDYYTSDAEVRVPPGWLEDRVFSGHEGIEEVAGLWTQSVSEYRWDIEELLDAGDCVVGLFRFSSRINSADRWIAPPLGAVFTMREGKVARVRTYFSWSEAREAAGMEETG
jgi:ketosteroid isomerase-like protein